MLKIRGCFLPFFQKKKKQTKQKYRSKPDWLLDRAVCYAEMVPCFVCAFIGPNFSN